MENAALQKPGGAYFDACAKGRLLLLSPSAWPFVPGRKPVDRVQSCVLNSIAQSLCGEGAATIDYKGVVPERIERWVGEAVRLERRPERQADSKVAQEG